MFFNKKPDKEHEKRLSALENAVHKLVEDRDLLRNEFARLRGTVTGGLRLRMVGKDGVDSIPFGDKDALRARAGLVSGKRPVHDE